MYSQVSRSYQRSPVSRSRRAILGVPIGSRLRPKGGSASGTSVRSDSQGRGSSLRLEMRIR